ncbi:amino-acid N-acetyltransferase [Mucilaginibacter frigoritolerans]|jgi:amino-acid N-acetyltransferase|uniref:Amino-acid N-acetyltransferase n=1 Tax=Mucilaginibacter frigoritolerans TaxID=652788 RepID=A0A562TL26_9SPHI|nr:arsenic resistance N-acetyltransferase ArsN2 [Mucilaginibacter frigoritolerans]TWI94192.1 amino-acid N-acetyltransferase [Mucilaginibacter frigoritolerans]
MKIENAANYRDEVIGLLATENLPVADLPLNLNNFLVALQNNEVIGVAGLEVYGTGALLRSLAVHAAHRGQGIADQLLQNISALGSLKGINELYLLTETAPAYFEKKGFVNITRAEVPAGVQQSSEFSHVCPQSAIVMKKII